ncbi:glycosyltransferase family 2 protein [Mariniflexile sp.]|uniref:glycosyltransferase family 2 protein n=1 Tax=Mariniflexile sp. TaxID=1979402 RepID=UPI0035618AEA
MIKDLVSILIPVYNRVNLIEETIQSAANQSYTNIEIIVVDNCSTDGTWELLEKLALNDNRLRVFRNDENIGPVRNWKRCVDEAKGEFSKILWSDDLIHEDFIKETIPFFENKEVGFVYTSTVIFMDNIHNVKSKIHETFKKTKEFSSNIFIKKMFFSGTYSGKVPYSPGCAIFRTIALKEALKVDIPNYFDYDFSKIAIGNDVLCFLITASKYKKVSFVNKRLSYFREHSDSISTDSGGSKLALFYNAAKGYYLSNYEEKNIGIYSINMWQELKKFKNDNYKFDKLIHFYPKAFKPKGILIKVLNYLS